MLNTNTEKINKPCQNEEEKPSKQRLLKLLSSLHTQLNNLCISVQRKIYIKIS